jgi:hypothetical protein
MFIIQNNFLILINMLPFKKIYVDSIWCTCASVDASNFKVELPQTMLRPENIVCFISDVCIPHTWNTAEAGFNDQLYITRLNGNTYSSYMLTLAPGNYNPATFASQLQTQFQTIASIFTATVDTNNVIIISVNQNPAYAFKIWTDDA